MLNAGKDLAAVLQTLEASESSYRRWKNQYGGIMVLKLAPPPGYSRKLEFPMAFTRIRGLATSLAGGLCLVAFVAPPAQAALAAIGPLPYLSAADSPFVNDPSLVTILEDFEDGALNVPWIVNDPISRNPPAPNDGRGVVLAPGITTDSVDGDDGAIDGFGNGGYSFQSTDFFPAITFPTTFYSTLVFHFEPLPNGQYPTAFGFVWTDGEPESNVVIVVREGSAPSADGVGFPVTFGDQVFSGETAEDRFVGVVSDVGIQRIVIESLYFARSEIDNGAGRRQSFELDHLQFAYALIPEPRAVMILSSGAVILCFHRRRR